MLAFDPATYDEARNRLDRETSLLSPYLHFGAVSARELEERSSGAYARQLAWRDFYAHVLLKHPDNRRHAFKRELDAITWEGHDEHFDAWRGGPDGLSRRRRRDAPARSRRATCTTAPG